jgi:hypothetical protein
MSIAPDAGRMLSCGGTGETQRSPITIALSGGLVTRAGIHVESQFAVALNNRTR